jgi:hypothetical protein
VRKPSLSRNDYFRNDVQGAFIEVQDPLPFWSKSHGGAAFATTCKALSSEVQDPLPFWSIFKRDQRVLEHSVICPAQVRAKCHCWKCGFNGLPVDFAAS